MRAARAGFAWRALAALHRVFARAAPLAQNAANGKSLYKTYCQVCHTVGPQHGGRAVQPDHVRREQSGADHGRGERRPVADGMDHDDAHADRSRGHRRVPRDVRGAAPATGRRRRVLQRRRATTTSCRRCRRDRRPRHRRARRVGRAPGSRSRHTRSAAAARARCAASTCRRRTATRTSIRRRRPSARRCGAQYPGFVYETPTSLCRAARPWDRRVRRPATVPVYRVWDNRADTNHRYTTSVAVAAADAGRWTGSPKATDPSRSSCARSPGYVRDAPATPPGFGSGRQGDARDPVRDANAVEHERHVRAVAVGETSAIVPTSVAFGASAPVPAGSRMADRCCETASPCRCRARSSSRPRGNTARSALPARVERQPAAGQSGAARVLRDVERPPRLRRARPLPAHVEVRRVGRRPEHRHEIRGDRRQVARRRAHRPGTSSARRD